MLHLILAAIFLLRPALPHKTAKTYAKHITSYSEKASVDPFLTVAVIQRETGGTWRSRLKSPTKDYGLMQIHVTEESSPMFFGKEGKLYDPKTNIRRGVYLLSYYRDWHRANCGAKPKHPYWVHYKFGHRRPPKGYEDQVGPIYSSLLFYFLGHFGEV